jgi:large subunit ribosomal protein L25
MRKDITVAAEPRAVRGKNEMNRLRAKGMSPAVVYGTGADPVAVSVNPRDLMKILHSPTGHNTIFNLAVNGGETSPVMIVDWQMEPVKDFLLHSDFKRIDLTKRIAVKVPVHTHGDPVGVKIQGGQHEIINREIEIECLPDDIPEFFQESIAELNIGQALRARDVKLGEGMVLLSDPQLVVSHVVSTRTSDVAAAAADGAGDGKSEPEVLKAKGKKEDADAAGKPAAAKPAAPKKK